MFGILSEELLKASKCEPHFIHETLSTCLEVWHLLRVKYRGVRCRLKKGCRDRRCLGWFVPTEQRPDKPQKRMAKKLGIILLHMCVSPRHSLHVRRSLGEFSRSRMLTCNIFRYCSFFFSIDNLFCHLKNLIPSGGRGTGFVLYLVFLQSVLSF